MQPLYLRSNLHSKFCQGLIFYIGPDTQDTLTQINIQAQHANIEGLWIDTPHAYVSIT